MHYVAAHLRKVGLLKLTFRAEGASLACSQEVKLQTPLLQKTHATISGWPMKAHWLPLKRRICMQIR